MFRCVLKRCWYNVIGLGFLVAWPLESKMTDLLTGYAAGTFEDVFPVLFEHSDWQRDFDLWFLWFQIDDSTDHTKSVSFDLNTQVAKVRNWMFMG